MQNIVVEVFGQKKTVTIDQLRDVVSKNFISRDTEIVINGITCHVSDVYDQLVNGATTLDPFKDTPSSYGNSTTKNSQSQNFQDTKNTSVDPFEEKKHNDSPVPHAHQKNKSSSRSRNKKDYPHTRLNIQSKFVAIVFALFVICIVLIAFIIQRSPKQQDPSIIEYNQGEENEELEEWLFDSNKNTGQKTKKIADTHKGRYGSSELYDNSQTSVSISSSKQVQTSNKSSQKERSDFIKASNVFDVDWDSYIEKNELPTPEAPKQTNPTGIEIYANDHDFVQISKDLEEPRPLLVVDHDKIFAKFFSYDEKKDKIPSTVTVNSSQQLEQALAKLENKSQTIVLAPNTAPYELKKSVKIEGEITIRGKSGNPLDAWILIVPESTPRLGAFEVSGGKLTLEGVTIKRNAPCSEEFALVSVDAKGEANINNCVFDALDAKSGRGVYVNGIGSSATLKNSTFKGFDDGVYVFNSSTTNVSDGCAFEENARGATVASGAELNVSDSSFTRNGVGVQAKMDGSGSLTKSTFENNDVPCEVDSYSEKKFKRTNNIGLN